MVAGIAFERKRHTYLHARAIYAAHPNNANYRSLAERVGREYIAVADPVIFNEHELAIDMHTIARPSEL